MWAWRHPQVLPCARGGQSLPQLPVPTTESCRCPAGARQMGRPIHLFGPAQAVPSETLLMTPHGVSPAGGVLSSTSRWTEEAALQ